MEVKVRKPLSQKVTYDSKLNGLEKKVKSPIKEQKFNEMVDRLGEKKIKSLLMS